jgi:hypothetical protein
MTKPQRINLLLDLYPKGYSLREIAAQANCTFELIRRYAHTFGVELRPAKYQSAKQRRAA